MANNHETALREALKRAIEARTTAEAEVARQTDTLELARKAVGRAYADCDDVEKKMKEAAESEVDAFVAALGRNVATAPPADLADLKTKADRQLEIARAAVAKSEENLRTAEAALRSSRDRVKAAIGDLLATRVDTETAEYERMREALERRRQRLFVVARHLSGEAHAKAWKVIDRAVFQNGKDSTIEADVATARIAELHDAPFAPLPI